MKTCWFIILIGLLFLSPISKAPAQNLWSVQNQPPDETAFGLCLALLPYSNELTGGVEFGMANDRKIGISGGLNFFSNASPGLAAKIEGMQFVPFDKRTNFFGIGNLAIGTVGDFFTYGFTAGLGIMSRIQGANSEVAVTPFARLAAQGEWLTGGSGSIYLSQLEAQIGFELEPRPNNAIMVSLVLDLSRDDLSRDTSTGVLLSYNFR